MVYKLDLENGVVLPRSLSSLAEASSYESVSPSGETYLRLGEVDLDDPEEILAFVSGYGLLGGAFAYTRLINNAPYKLKQMYGPGLDLTREREKKSRALWNELTGSQGDHVDELHGSEAELERTAMTQTEYRALTETETLDEFRFAARCVRDLTSAWQMFRQGSDATTDTWVSPSYVDPELIGTDAFPILLFSVVFQTFMRPFSPQLGFSWSGPGSKYVRRLTELPPRTNPSGVNLEPLTVPRQAELYEICALELFNHIIENAEYNRCANERCQRTFVHQQGRAEKGQHRSRGVLYCSPSCARATAQRDYRRRKRNRQSG